MNISLCIYSYIYHIHVSASSVSVLFVSLFKLLWSHWSLNSIFYLYVAWQWAETFPGCWCLNLNLVRDGYPTRHSCVHSLSQDGHCAFDHCLSCSPVLDSGYGSHWKVQIHLFCLLFFLLFKKQPTSLDLSDIRAHNKHMLQRLCACPPPHSSIKVLKGRFSF